MRITRGLTAAFLACALPETPVSAQTTYLLCTTEEGEEIYYSFGSHDFQTYSERNGWSDNLCLSDEDWRPNGRFADLNVSDCKFSSKLLKAARSELVSFDGVGGSLIHSADSFTYLINRRTGYYEHVRRDTYNKGQWNEDIPASDVRRAINLVTKRAPTHRETGTCEVTDNPEAEAKF